MVLTLRWEVLRHKLIATLRYGIGFLCITGHWPHLMMAGPKEFAAIQHSLLKLFQVQINYRRNKEGDELRDHQPADDNQTQWPAGRTVGAIAECDGQCAK